MKKLLALSLCGALSWGLIAQGAATLAQPDPAAAQDSAAIALREISIDLFEREGSWNPKISTDDGVITARLFDGSPNAKEPLPQTGDATLVDSKVLGVKASFFHRGKNTFYISATRPLPVEGIVKTVSLWVAGRNQGHTLWLVVQDYFGTNFELYIDSLAYSGWKKLVVAIPPSRDGVHGIVQASAHFGERPGLKIVGFKVECNPEDARGSYYIYFDDLRVVTDMYDSEYRDSDDISDNW
ncbi:MAG: flagellar filament outer layer protein FlaA [Treponemataceae bacterium]|nr:MAG: flagellar filament outer layer protein FlaA [Treponemataceae bacterium]